MGNSSTSMWGYEHPVVGAFDQEPQFHPFVQVTESISALCWKFVTSNIFGCTYLGGARLLHVGDLCRHCYDCLPMRVQSLSLSTTHTRRTMTRCLCGSLTSCDLSTSRMHPKTSQQPNHNITLRSIVYGPNPRQTFDPIENTQSILCR